jgi:hypothetical protein
MSQPIVYVDTSEVRAGRLDELKDAMKDLTEFVEANEPQLIAYHVCFSGDGTRMTVLHINRDSASLRAHLAIAGPKFPPIGELIDMLAIDVYGRPDDDLVRQLRDKPRCWAAAPYASMTCMSASLVCRFAHSAIRSGAQIHVGPWPHEGWPATAARCRC